MKTINTAYVFETATNTDGMKKKDAARFHAFNPNGVVAKLPTDFSLPNGKWATGCESMWSRYHNYHAKAITKYALGKTRFTRWELNYAVRECAKDVDECARVMSEKRAD